MAKSAKSSNSLAPAITSLIRVHFAYVAIYAAQVIAFDAWKLITPYALWNRWLVAVIMLVVTTLVWYIARTIANTESQYKALAFTLVLMDVAVATFSVYSQRGMASRGVALYAIAIASAAILQSRSAIYATACLCTAGYTAAAIRYFVVHPSEGYKVELYGEVAFYSALFFVLAAIMWVVVRARAAAATK